MPICSVYGCPNYSTNGLSMKFLPRNPERRKLWLERINAANPTNFQLPSRICLCEAHFGPEMWQEQNDEAGPRKLKQNALPTLFPLQLPENEQTNSLDIRRSSGTNCCVSGCTSRKQTDPSLHFFQFPKRGCQTVPVTTLLGKKKFIQRGKIWEKVLKMTKPPSSRMTVCSKHFRESDFYMPNKRLHLRPTAIPSLNLPSLKLIHFRDNETVKLSDLSLEEIKMISEEKTLKTWINKKSSIRFIDTITTNSELNSLTNIKTFTTLNYLAKSISEEFHEAREVKERILLVMITLKLSLPFKLISFLFQVRISKCKEIFNEYLEYLCKVLERKPFRSLTVLDWFELEISNNKSCKILAGFSREGFVTFLTKTEEQTFLKQRFLMCKEQNFKSSERIEQNLRTFYCLNGRGFLLQQENLEKIFQVCSGLVNLQSISTP